MSTSITQHPTWGPQMEDSLREIPTVSLVQNGSVSQTESETSLELIFPDGTTGFQIDCGVEHFGGHSINSPKKNMRMSFKKVYGASRLNYDLYGGDAAKDFDQIILRTGSHDNWFWTHPSGHGGVYVRGRWCFDRQLEAGNVAPRGRWVHVYLNGTYHGLHHLMERPNAAFMASYLGGEKENYEALNAGTPINGDKSTWNAMKGVLGDYQQLKTHMDVKNYADYMSSTAAAQRTCGRQSRPITNSNYCSPTARKNSSSMTACSPATASSRRSTRSPRLSKNPSSPRPRDGAPTGRLTPGKDTSAR